MPTPPRIRRLRAKIKEGKQPCRVCGKIRRKDADSICHRCLLKQAQELAKPPETDIGAGEIPGRVKRLPEPPPHIPKTRYEDPKKHPRGKGWFMKHESRAQAFKRCPGGGDSWEGLKPGPVMCPWCGRIVKAMHAVAVVSKIVILPGHYRKVLKPHSKTIGRERALLPGKTMRKNKKRKIIHLCPDCGNRYRPGIPCKICENKFSDDPLKIWETT